MRSLRNIALAWATISLAAESFAAPLHDPIPKEFHGTFAPSLEECAEEYGTEGVVVEADGLHHYEADDYLLIGVSFAGSSTKSKKMVPIFHGRFTGRMETQLLGEMNTRLELETPNLLIRYAISEDGEPDPRPVNIWIRCPPRK